MKKRNAVLLGCVSLSMLTSACAVNTGLFGFTLFSSGKEDEISEQEQMILDALSEEAQVMIDRSRKPSASTAPVSDYLVHTVLPAKFDLRAVDTNRDGIPENYVTSVKQQRPFGSCWAFSTIAAAETSILYELGQESVITSGGELKDAIDLSEHHLAWFAYTPVEETDNQTGEGLYSRVNDEDRYPSLKMNSRATQFSASSIFASGIGPVKEPEENTEDRKEAELLYRGKEGITVYKENIDSTVYSEEDDWSVNEDLRFRQDYMLEETLFLPSTVQFDEQGSYDMEYADQMVRFWKAQLMKGRPIAAAYCSDTYLPEQTDKDPVYLNTKDNTWAHYCYEPAMQKHAVTIIGWDDSYSKENFLSEIPVKDEEGNVLVNEDGSRKTKAVSQPPKSGAWIVKNSWGALDSIGQGITESDWGVDGSGYFYLSYYDQTIASGECFDFDVENRMNQDSGECLLHQHDFMFSEMPHAVVTSFPVETANVFIAEQDEVLRAVSCVTTQAKETVDITVYLLSGDTFRPEKDRKLCSFSERVPYAGLHVLDLPEQVSVNKGQRFAVSIAQHAGEDYLFSVGCEFNEKGYVTGYSGNGYARGVVNAGESYVYFPKDRRCRDFCSLKTALETMEGPSSFVTCDNFPIKVYALPQ